MTEFACDRNLDVKNPLKAEPDWPQAVVAGAHQTGVNLMRNLARRGVRVSCVDSIPGQPGFRTVYGKGYHCPDFDTQPNEWRDFMTDLAQKLGGKPVLIAASDQYVTAIATYAPALVSKFIFYREGAIKQALLATKEQHYDIAAEHGMPIPSTKLVKCQDDVVKFATTARFPCLFKPLTFRDWERCPLGHPLANTKVVLANSQDELIANYQMCAKITPEMIVQELIEGPDTAKLVYISCYGGDKRRLGSCIVRELRTWPIGFGPATVVEPFADDEVAGICDRFLCSFGYQGICEIELKRDSRDGRVKMIEANPRHSGTGDAAPYAGVEIGWLHYLDLIGVSVTEVFQQECDFRHIVLLKDLAVIRHHCRKNLITWREVIRSYRFPLAFYDFHLRDWRLTAENLIQAARVIVGGLIRTVFPKSGGGR